MLSPPPQTDAFPLHTKDLFKLFYSRYNASMTCHFLWNTLLHFGLTRYFPNDYLSSALCLSNEQKVQGNKINKPQQNNEKATMHHWFSRGKNGTNKESIPTWLLLNTQEKASVFLNKLKHQLGQLVGTLRGEKKKASQILIQKNHWAVFRCANSRVNHEANEAAIIRFHRCPHT